MKGYIEIADELDWQFKAYCNSHSVEYKSVDDDGLYRVSGPVVNMVKFIYRMKKLHKNYLKEIEA